MAISTADFKNGMCIEYNGKLWTIVEFQHVKPGKGGAFVRTKLRDVRTGRIVDNTFNAGTKFDSVRMETRKMQYLYNDGADFNFMDNNTYEQEALSADVVGDVAKWLKENDEVSLQYAGDELIGIEPMMFVELAVSETEPGFKGDTVQGQPFLVCRRDGTLLPGNAVPFHKSGTAFPGSSVPFQCDCEDASLLLVGCFRHE